MQLERPLEEAIVILNAEGEYEEEKSASGAYKFSKLSRCMTNTEYFPLGSSHFIRIFQMLMNTLVQGDNCFDRKPFGAKVRKVTWRGLLLTYLQ